MTSRAICSARTSLRGAARSTRSASPWTTASGTSPPPTVDAYYNPQMNDINFPAGVLQPPLYDRKMDDAPNYGDTGGTIGHELTHGFDDEGSQFDATGNLKDWWTKEDREKFDERTKCVDDQYSSYVSVEDVHLNGKLTLGENVADLGGEILAFMAWKEQDQGHESAARRWFDAGATLLCRLCAVGLRQRAPRRSARARHHRSALARASSASTAWSSTCRSSRRRSRCKAGQPMVNRPDKMCKVW